MVDWGWMERMCDGRAWTVQLEGRCCGGDGRGGGDEWAMLVGFLCIEFSVLAKVIFLGQQ